MSAALLAIARGYPYEAPSRSFLYRDGAEHPLPVSDSGHLPVDQWRREGRVPVLAYGANRSATALARKFAGWPSHTSIPVTHAKLDDHDIVYSAHLSRYGSAPAKIEHVEGVTVEVGVIWLDPAQLERMHETEGALNYRFEEIRRLTLTFSAFETVLDQAYAYVGRRPTLSRDDAPIPLSAIKAESRRHKALSQAQVLEHIRDRLAPGATMDDFILQTIGCPITRLHRTERLGRVSGRRGVYDLSA